MNILGFSHSPLSWRPLLPVVCELVRRGHQITIHTTRANWRGLPTFQMAFRPRFVTGINKAMLAWVSRLDGYGADWREAQKGIRYEVHPFFPYVSNAIAPERYDCVVATTKDMTRLNDIGGQWHMRTVAIGCQHWPAVSTDHGESGVGRDFPRPFFPGRPFFKHHGFGDLMRGRLSIMTGFPHLDRIRLFSPRDPNRVHLIHHGGYRGLEGHDWMLSILRACNEAGWTPSVSPHGIHGWGYGAGDLEHAVLSSRTWCLPVRDGYTAPWWSIVGACSVILTTGSATIYDLWSLGKRNVLVLDYLGGGRSKAFSLFPDILVHSEAELIQRLRERDFEPKEPLTKEVIDAFASLHTGHATEIAADVVEGKR